MSVLEYVGAAEAYDGPSPGERVVVGSVIRNRHLRDDVKEGFVKVAESVATVELYRPIAESKVTEWCNSETGKLALAHWLDHVSQRR